MGVMILAVTATLVFIHFPMWGGMLTRGNPAVTEEDYYRSVGCSVETRIQPFVVQ